LSERFDSTIGAASVLMPFGGKNQLTPTQAMVFKIPVLNKETKTCSAMAYGFNPYISEESPFHGAYTAVVESISKLVATGFSRKGAYLTFQEYFERLGAEAKRWGKPLAALLGALKAQLDFETAAIGGKDSMSGSFEDIDVPPTLTSFAVAIGNTDNVISPEFKCPASNVCFIAPKKKADGTLDTQSYLETLDLVEKLIKEKKVLSAWTPTYGGIAEGIFKMAIGSNVGFKMSNSFDEKRLYGYNYGAFILEMADETIVGEILGETIGKAELRIGSETLQLKDLLNVYENKLESVFPYHSVENTDEVQTFNFTSVQRATPKIGIAKPKVLIPVFPGTNCEYDTARALIRAGAEPDIMVIKNLSGADIEQSIATMVSKIEASQMIVIPGGFSGG
ncbi:MAG: phosphoribosylformylglycinamidine synthase subunit PurQ, partial [Oscillospiraceae bacterium]